MCRWQMNGFNFQYPYVLGLIFLFIICNKYCKERSKAIYFPHVGRLIVNQAKAGSLLNILKWLGILFSLIALASPVISKTYTNSKKEGRDIVLILDSSGSMREPFDASYRSRFEVVKEVVSDFIEKRESDRIGLVTFADVAFIASPLTFEKKFLTNITKMQQIGVAGRKTAINDAIVQGYNLLSKSKAKSKIAILLTDGADNMSKIPFQDVKHLIENQEIKLYAVGVGREGVDFEGEYLQALAKAGKGRAYGASDASTLNEIYDEIDKLEATKIDNKKIVQHTYFYAYPLMLGWLFLLLFVFLRNKRGV